MMKLLTTLLIATSLAGCVITGKTSDGMSIVKPSRAQIDSAAKRIVCDSFSPLYFSGSKDSRDTIRAIREHNAAWKSYGCKK
jgi:hypothetical protein